MDEFFGKLSFACFATTIISVAVLGSLKAFIVLAAISIALGQFSRKNK